jgi:inorganic pyrophosphatase
MSRVAPASFLAGFSDELAKIAMSTGAIESALSHALERDPNRLAGFIQHMRQIGSPKALEAKELAVQKARRHLAGIPQFAGEGVKRTGNILPDIAGEIITKHGAPSRRALARMTEMSLLPVTKRRRLPLGKRWLWKKAGVAKRQMAFDGRTIKIEYDVGDTRSGVNKKTGEPWEKVMKAAYGYIPRTKGVDGEAVDVYLAKDPKPGQSVYVVHQVKEDGSHDEDKCMLGFDSAAAARAAYLAHTPKQFLGSMAELSPEKFAAYLEKNHYKDGEHAGKKRS